MTTGLEKLAWRIQRTELPAYIVHSDLAHAPLLSARLGRDVWLKREEQQPIFSFKVRGAYIAIRECMEKHKAPNIMAASAGNHAQGVALAAKHLGITAHIVMPVTSPQIKVDAVRRWGAEVILHGDFYADCAAHAKHLSRANGWPLIPPFDALPVIAGQGTVAREILAAYDAQNTHRSKNTPIEAIFVPSGGGGLIAGMAAYIAHFAPHIKVIGVEAVDSAGLKASLDAGARVALAEVGLFADGTSVQRIGRLNWAVIKHTVDTVITITTDEMCAAIKDGFYETRTILEPSGALAIAAMKKYAQANPHRKGTLVGVLTGANINFSRLRHVCERADIGEDKEAILAIQIPETPGSFLALCTALAGRAITEFHYRYQTAQNAVVFAGVGIDTAAERGALVATLRTAGYICDDLTEDTLAKTHIRYMIGGHGGDAKNAAIATTERLYRFVFPERPGALLAFLRHMNGPWNISLFHYRNHGSDYARVVAGFQVRPTDTGHFETAVASLGYSFWEETDNPAYRLFLKPTTPNHP